MTGALRIKACATVACVFVLTVGGCTIRENELRHDLIKSGVDPMALSCAADIGTNEQHICTIIAQRGEKK